jgi:DNA-binding NtrC family response regulator
LDEIGDRCPKGQGDLLRVLDDAMFRPVGSSRTLRADVRVIAATNRDLADMANEGRFREDLLYRLNIVELSIPPLRERTEDIAALVDSFNAQFSARHGKQKKKLSQGFIERLTCRFWPGNVRQLRNLIERLVVTVARRRLVPGMRRRSRRLRRRRACTCCLRWNPAAASPRSKHGLSGRRSHA